MKALYCKITQWSDSEHTAPNQVKAHGSLYGRQSTAGLTISPQRRTFSPLTR